MLQHFDITGAAAALRIISNDRVNSPHSQLHLANMFESERMPYRAEKDGGIWRLVFNTSQHGAAEEVVASMQGILCKAGLPPFLDQFGINSSNAKFLRQSARITGLGNPSFEKLTANIARVQAIFKRAIGPQLQNEYAHLQQDGCAAIDASNRYFSLRTESNQGDECLITDDMDPKGFLRRAAGATYFHAEDNKVHYFEMYEGGVGEASFKETGPHIFQEGDIVELQVSFIVIPLRDQKSRMSIVLRSISLMEGKFTQASNLIQEAFVKAASAEKVAKLSTKMTLKRKVGYVDEELSVTRSKLAVLDIADARGSEGDEETSTGSG